MEMEIRRIKTKDERRAFGLIWKTKKIIALADDNNVLRFYHAKSKKQLWDEQVPMNWIFKISMFELEDLCSRKNLNKD